jgi:hypothetical protein
LLVIAMQTEEISHLLEEFEAAFGDLPMPSSDRIVIDNSDAECQQVRKKFQNRHWRDLTIDDLAYDSDALFFFTPEAFRFYLPAFLSVSLTDAERADLIPDAVLSSLSSPADPGFCPQRRASLLDRAEAQGIPESLVSELLTTGARDNEVEMLKEARRDALSTEQRTAVLHFVSFLRRNRKEEFSSEELERIEAALAT